jgi:polyphosphate kinase
MLFFNRDISWLQFNLRVLLEAKNPSVPLYERIKFLSIFSSNLDEFFRVRYPALLALKHVEILLEKENGSLDNELLETILSTINEHQQLFGNILRTGILPELLKEKIHLYFQEPIAKEHSETVTDFFYTKVLSFIQPVILSTSKEKFELQNNCLYFFVELQLQEITYYSIINIPHGNLNRFMTLPDLDGYKQIIFLDDVVRFNIDKAFPGYIVKGCFSIKLTRSADINLANEWSDMLESQVLKMIKDRERGTPSRFLFEKGMSEKARDFIKEYFGLTENEMIEGSCYHNFKDLFSLPNPVGKALLYQEMTPIIHQGLRKFSSLFNAITASDHLLHFPYQSYNYILRFFNEAAIDRDVEEIYVTLYRVASDSHIVNALISAAKNGKKVSAFVELKARFDEENNLIWSQKMKSAGVKIIYSIPNLKVHSKLALVKRRNESLVETYGLLSTGNFNESTARFYTDHLLLTSDPKITSEVDQLFTYLLSRQQPEDYHFITFAHLIVSRFNLIQKFEALVNREIENKQNGKEASITLKLNNLEEKGMIELLYKASCFGVTVNLLIRGICCLIPGKKGLSENITVKRIIDRYLEHSRVFIFSNDKNPEVYLGSADLMNRNIHRRIEVIFPVYKQELKKDILQIIRLQLDDNVQAVELDSEGKMSFCTPKEGEIHVQSQLEIYKYLAQQVQ